MRKLSIVLFSLFIGACSVQDEEYSLADRYIESFNSRSKGDLVFIYNLEGCYSCLNAMYNLQNELSETKEVWVILVGSDLHQIRKEMNDDKILIGDHKYKILKYIPDFNNGIIVERNNRKIIKINDAEDIYSYSNSL
jgi:hypothetical protein